MPAASLSAACDLVIIDGRHDFDAVVDDFVNLHRLASPDALFIFDDICKIRGCESWLEGTAVHMGGPTLAACELGRAGFISTVERSYGGVRQWLLARANHSAPFDQIGCQSAVATAAPQHSSEVSA